MSAPFAKAGHEIRDGAGKLVATVARDIAPGETVQHNQFTFADGRQPAYGEMLPRPVADFVRFGA